jgi:hypothetical protein
MNVLIRNEDRQAMDLIMDRSLMAASKAEGKSVYAAAHGDVRQRANAVEKVLGLLDNLAATEPPANMLKRTLRYVEDASAQTGSSNGRTSHSFTIPPPLA